MKQNKKAGAPEPWKQGFAPGRHLVFVPDIVKPINAGNADRAELIVAAVNAITGAGRMPDAMRSFIEGMSVSVDVSTGEDDAGNRYFGTVSEVMDDLHDKHGVTLLVQNATPNFQRAAATPTCPCFPGTCRGGDVVNGVLANGSRCRAQS